MTIYYNAQDRKPLVKAISEFTGADAVYMRTRPLTESTISR